MSVIITAQVNKTKANVGKTVAKNSKTVAESSRIGAQSRKWELKINKTSSRRKATKYAKAIFYKELYF